MPNNFCLDILLPYHEGFGPDNAGAIGLYVRETTSLSRFCGDITVWGRDLCQPFTGLSFAPLAPRWPRLRGRNASLASAYRHQASANERRPTMVEVHNRPAIALDLAKKMPATAVTLYLHNDPHTMRAARTKTERSHLLNHCAGVICCSHYIRGRLLENLESFDHKVFVAPSGVLIPDPTAVAKENLILYVGRLIPEKGVLPWIESLETLLPQNPTWRAVIVGAARPAGSLSTPYAQSCYDRFVALGPQAQFMGYQPFDTVQALFSRAAIAVVPSVWEEPLGRVAIEALAGGCALVTSGRGGLAEIVNDDCAAVCAPTVQALRATLETLIAHPELRHQLSRNAIDRAKAYDLMAVTRDLDEARATIVALHEARHA